MLPDSFRFLFSPRWLTLIVLSIAASALAAGWMGMQQEERHTATTFIFGRRVGYIDRPLLLLDDHLNDIVNAVEFPAVFLAIEDRTQLQSDRDYDFTIERLDSQQSVVAVEVRAARSGDAERISRILAEEVVIFVLREQDESLAREIQTVDSQLTELANDQLRLRSQSFGVSPQIASTRIEQELAVIDQLDGIAGNVEGELLRQLAVVEPLVGDYQRNTIEIFRLTNDRAKLEGERLDITSSIVGINGDWYRSITPVEPASNVPLAIAMGFAAAVPTALVSTALVLLNLNRRLTGRLLPRRARPVAPAT